MPAPLARAERVAKALIGWGGLPTVQPSFNGDPGVVFYDSEELPVWVSALEIADERGRDQVGVLPPTSWSTCGKGS